MGLSPHYYVAGGIAPKIDNRLKDGGFMRAFSAKGTFAPLLSGIPVRVMMDAQVGLRGGRCGWQR